MEQSCYAILLSRLRTMDQYLARTIIYLEVFALSPVLLAISCWERHYRRVRYNQTLGCFGPAMPRFVLVSTINLFLLPNRKCRCFNEFPNLILFSELISSNFVLFRSTNAVILCAIMASKQLSFRE